MEDRNRDDHNQLWVSLQHHIDERFTLTDKEMSLFRENLEARLESMNQFREDLRAQAMHFMTRPEFNLAHDRIVDDIKSLQDSRARLETKASQMAVTITFVLAAVGIMLSLVSLLHNMMSKP